MNYEQVGYLFGKAFLILLVLYFGIKGGKKIEEGMRKKKVEDKDEQIVPISFRLFKKGGRE